MYDFDFSSKPTDEICAYNDTVNNPNPKMGCQFYQAALGFSGFGWYPPCGKPTNFRLLWTVSMTWNISRIHKFVRKQQMGRINEPEKEFANRRDMESQGSTYASRNHFTNSPLHDVDYSKYPASL